jgi:hypothetical protein
MHVWASLVKLESLKELSVFSNGWIECVALIKTVGHLLTKLSLALEGRRKPIQLHETPRVEDVLGYCQRLEEFCVDIGAIRLRVSPESISNNAMYHTLRSIRVRNCVTFSALLYLFKRYEFKHQY